MPDQVITITNDNELAARQNAEALRRAGVFAVVLAGPAGCGKSSLIEATLRRLKFRAAVIVAHPAAHRDANRLAPACHRAVAIDAPVADARLIREALGKIDLEAVDLVLIEWIAATADLPRFGQDVTVSVLSVSGGDDKADEYAALIADTPVLLLTQTDLLPHVTFDRTQFLADVARINRATQVIEISAVGQGGLEPWLDWINARCDEKQRLAGTMTQQDSKEWFFG